MWVETWSGGADPVVHQVEVSECYTWCRRFLALKSDDNRQHASSSSVYMLTPDVVDAKNTTMVRRIGRPLKDEQPVITLEHPWEHALYLCGHSMIEVGSQLYLYYTSVLPYPKVSHGGLLLLATSGDGGKTWKKPILNLVEYNGSTANNIVITGIVNGGNAFADPAAPARALQILGHDCRFAAGT